MTTSLRTAAGRLARLALLAACLAALPGPAVADAAAGDPAAAAPAASAALLAELETYADAVVADLDAFWAERLPEAGADYRSPEVVFYTETVRTPCGLELVPGVTAPGFYCPLDERVYLDGVDHVAVAEVLGRSWLATVLGHEWGHHVQMLLGTFAAGPTQPEAVVARLELQADCLAGGWTVDADGRGLIEADAVDVAVYILAYLGAPPQQEVGMNKGHGTSEQRVRAVLRGYDHGTAPCLA
jgi:hypothetical protein